MSSANDPADELEHLRRRVAELEALLAQRQQEDEVTERLKAIIEYTPDVISTADSEGRVIFINPAGRRLLGGADNLSEEPRIPQFHPAWAADLILNRDCRTLHATGSGAARRQCSTRRRVRRSRSHRSSLRTKMLPEQSPITRQSYTT